MRWASDPIINLTKAPALAVSGPPIYVQDWWGATFQFTPMTSPGCRLRMTWGQLSADGTTIDPNQPNNVLQFSANTNGMSHVLPHLGPYLQCSVDISVGPGQYNLLMRHTNRQERSAEIIGSSLLFVPTTPFPVGTTIYEIPGYVGPAYIYGNVGAGNVSIQIHGHDIVTLVDELFDQIYNPNTAAFNTPREIWLPPLCNEVWVVNTAAGPENVNFAIQPAYR